MEKILPASQMDQREGSNPTRPSSSDALFWLSGTARQDPLTDHPQETAARGSHAGLGFPPHHTAAALSRQEVGRTSGPRFWPRYAIMPSLRRPLKNHRGHLGAARHQEHFDSPANPRQTTRPRPAQYPRTNPISLKTRRPPTGHVDLFLIALKIALRSPPHPHPQPTIRTS